MVNLGDEDDAGPSGVGQQTVEVGGGGGEGDRASWLVAALVGADSSASTAGDEAGGRGEGARQR